jgi:hypothetical protein
MDPSLITENYQFSITWWIFRFVTFGEIVAIAYLFTTTWKLSKCIEKTHKMMSELLQTKQGCGRHQTKMDEVDQQFLDLHNDLKRKPEYD